MFGKKIRALRLLILGSLLLWPINNMMLAQAKTSAEKIRERRAAKVSDLANRMDCSTYEEELEEVQLNRKKVASFRREHLNYDFENLLDDFRLFWNAVHEAWERGDLSEKQFINEFRREYRYLRWYHKRDDDDEFREALAKLRDRLKGDLRAFAEKYFVVDTWSRDERSVQIRRTKSGRVFPFGSVLELADGELVVARYAKKRVGAEWGNFIIDINVRNDIYASRKLVVGTRQNFRSKAPLDSEILRTARESATVDPDSEHYHTNVTRLELLLDPRFEVCPEEKPRKEKKPKLAEAKSPGKSTQPSPR